MNTLTTILAVTCAILLAAVTVSFFAMKDGVANASPAEMQRIQAQLNQLRMEQDKLQLEQQIRDVRNGPVADRNTPSEVTRMRNELAAKNAEIEALDTAKSEAQKKADTYRDEAGFIGQRELEKNDDQLRRARLIKSALLIGRVSEYVDNPDLGSFLIIEVVMPEQMNVGDVLGIRRKTGIIGRVKIGEVTSEGAIGSVMPGFGPINPQAGDELIIPPQV